MTACVPLPGPIFTATSRISPSSRAAISTCPTGSGKTHLAEAVARSMDLAYLPISVSEWIVLGASTRGGAPTLPAICEFLNQPAAKDGCILYLDELDKIGRSLQSEWTRYQMTEVWGILDRRLPRNLTDSDGDAIHPSKIENAESILSSKTLIIAGGACQDLWDAPDPIGFGTPPERSPDLDTLSRYIPPELSRRFGSQLIVLPRLREDDYLDMLGQILPGIPDHWRARFESMALDQIPEAARVAQGPRFFEELLLEVAVQERVAVTRPTPLQVDTAIEEDGLGIF